MSLSSKQRKEIKKMMRRIKDARDDGKPKEVVKKRAKELYNYLEKEGLVDPFDE